VLAILKDEYFKNVTLRQLPIFYKIHKKENMTKKEIKIIGMIRERNESLLLKDTLDYMATFVDGIVVFDDASEDDSVQIALNHPSVIEVIQNKKWKTENRVWEETSNRKKLHDRAKKYEPEWLFYGDTDERCEGDIRSYLLNECPDDVNVLRIALFDAYMTEEDKLPYSQDFPLYNFRKMYGPERRDIVMAWRNGVGADFIVQDAREPHAIENRKEVTKFYCQHYGKALSIDQWEETCDYYINYFPKYREKWQERKGKAIHKKSDFGRPLYSWTDVKKKSVKIN
jgi:hypothetical protein